MLWKSAQADQYGSLATTSVEHTDIRALGLGRLFLLLLLLRASAVFDVIRPWLPSVKIGFVSWSGRSE
jgi:hypothetical protein